MTLGFISVHNPYLLGNIHGKLSPCRLRIHHRNSFKSRRMDSSVHTAPVDSKIAKEILVDADLEIINETASIADVWIR